MDKILTIGMAHHNDFDGAWFSIQDIRKELIFNGRMDLLRRIEFVIIENDKESAHAKSIQHFKNHGMGQIKVVELDEVQGTSATRNKIIEEARGEFVLVMDCHVLLCPTVKTLEQLFMFMDHNPDTKDLYTGPLVYDNLMSITTQYNDGWGAHMWGKWGLAWNCICDKFVFTTAETKDGKCQFRDNVSQKEITKCSYCNQEFPKIDWNGHDGVLKREGYNPAGNKFAEKPFEVFAQGLGMFFTKKTSWLKFNEHARGFGGEECYIHEKYRQAGRKTICLPFLKWLHRFERPNGVKYPLTVDNKLRNYILEFTELDLDLGPVKNHFCEESGVDEALFNKFVQEANEIYNKNNEMSEKETSSDLEKQIADLQEQLIKIQNKKCCKVK